VKGIYLEQARKRRKLTQEALEAKSGVAQSRISALENRSDIRVSAEILFALADALEVDARSLRFGPAPKRQRAGEMNEAHA